MSEFDFSVCERQIRKQYPHCCCSWDIQDVIDVVKYFTDAYQFYIYQSHPFMSNATIARVIEALPQDANGMDYDPDDYVGDGLIYQYFHTEFNHCNYSMLHFLSGDIRANRMCEMGIPVYH